MYNELVYALRNCVMSKPCDGCPYYDKNGPTKQCAEMNIAAADTIEKLTAENKRLRSKIRDMKSSASWDEDIRRGQVQGMW